MLLLLACQGLASLPSPPPARAMGTAPRAWGKPNCQNSSPLLSHLRGWCPYTSVFSVPVGSTQTWSPWPQERALGQSQWPSLTCPTWACQPGVTCLACQYLLSPYVPSTGPAGLPPLPPGSMPPSPSRPSPDSARTTVGPSVHSRSCPCASSPSSPRSGPGWNAQEPVPASPLLTGK